LYIFFFLFFLPTETFSKLILGLECFSNITIPAPPFLPISPDSVFLYVCLGCLTSVLFHKMVAQNSLAELVNCREEKPALFLVGIKRRLAGYVCAELLCPRFYILGSNQSCQVIFVILKI